MRSDLRQILEQEEPPDFDQADFGEPEIPPVVDTEDDGLYFFLATWDEGGYEKALDEYRAIGNNTAIDEVVARAQQDMHWLRQIAAQVEGRTIE